MKRSAFIALLFVASFFLPSDIVYGQAIISVNPSAGTYKGGELFSVLVNVNTGGQPINAGSAQLNFDNSRLEVVSLGHTQSIFTLWTQEPTFNNAAGTVTFSGGVPNPGFNGASGAILRVTFRTKAEGQAPLTFISGSILANDGEGTNIISSLNGAIYSIIAATPVAPTPTIAPSTIAPEVSSTSTIPVEDNNNVKALPPVETPLITEWPRQLESGHALSVHGLAIPVTKVLVSVQKGSEDVIREETFSGPDGQFKFTFSKAVKPGFYRLWARNLTNDGLASPTSDIVTVEVIEPSFFRVGTASFNYPSIVKALIVLVVFLLLVVVYLLWRIAKSRRRQSKEISGAEEAVDKAFDTLKEGLNAYVTYIASGKSLDAVKKREIKTRGELRGELDAMEEKIEKEIKDIKKK